MNKESHNVLVDWDWDKMEQEMLEERERNRPSRPDEMMLAEMTPEERTDYLQRYWPGWRYVPASVGKED